MENNIYVSQTEINEIEKIVLDKNVIDDRKKNNEDLFTKIQIKKALSIVKKNLKKDEIIDSYVTGRNYSIDSVRVALATSIMFSKYSHPILRWNSHCLLIKTNTRLILVELTLGFDYSTTYDIDSEIHLVTKNDNFYLIVSGNNKKTIIQFNNTLYTMTMDMLKNSAEIIIDRDFNQKALHAGISASIIFMIFVIIITIIFTFLLLKS